MTRNTECEVLVAGAGPTGLMLALWLARLGRRVRIIDKTDAPGTTSRALVVHARTLEFFQQLGIAETALTHGRKFNAIRMWARGELRGRVVLGDIGKGVSPFPFMLILPQDEEERILIETLRELGVEVERRTELVSFEDRGQEVVARLRLPDGGEETCTCAYLAGCDGAHSTVRHGLDVGFPGAAYSHMFYVADVHAHGPVVNGELNIALDTSDLLAIFPLPGEGNTRLIGTIERSVEDEDRAKLRWEDVSHTILEQLRTEVERVNWLSTYHVHHRVASAFRAGRAFLLGDAAHIHSPVGAQGMNTGLGDAVNLAWKLAMVIGGRADARLLDTYEPERIAFARRLVATTDRAFTFVTNDGPIARVVRVEIVPRLLPRILKVEAVRRFMFRTLSQTRIEYRAGALSSGRAGGVHGGDRLPWADGNFDVLRSLDWQAHVYGRASEALAETCNRLALPLHTFPWTEAAKRAKLREGALYVVRPDGHVALADPDADPTRLEAWLKSSSLSLGRVSG